MKPRAPYPYPQTPPHAERDRGVEQAMIDRKLAEFLAAGGTIQRIPSGVSGLPPPAQKYANGRGRAVEVSKGRTRT